jgi:protoporphyrinogen oxidase
MSHVKFLIIGAGPTGLGAAYRLKDLGDNDYLIIERENWAGGLASSFLDPNGFTWDIGGHVQFSHYEYFDRAMKLAIPEGNWLHHERESWVWMKQRFIPYPFQNNIRYLPKESMWNCLKGLMDLAKAPQQNPQNFYEWILASFGPGVAEEFMLPYNYKVWAFPPEDMAFQWIGERVATVNLERIIENIIFEKMDASWGPNNTFQFPEKGGTGAIWNSIAKHVGENKIRLNSEVVQVDSEEHVAILSDGREFTYDHLLSTMPVDIFTSIIKRSPSTLKSKIKELKHSSSNIIGIGVKGKPHPDLAKKCWMYFPEDSCPFYRMTVFSNYSPENVPSEEYYSLMCEVSESEKKSILGQDLTALTLKGLKSEGLLAEGNEVASKWFHRVEYGYPTPSLDRDNVLAEVIPQLDNWGTYSRGRFGGWKYEVSNQDHSFMQGVEWVDKIVSNISEKTYRVDTKEDPNLTLLKR